MQRRQLTLFSRESVKKAFDNLFRLLRIKHLERLSAIRSQPDFLFEDFIQYNDHRLNPEGLLEHRDDLFLLVGDSQTIDLDASFREVNCSFLAHKWSGKVNIQVDDHPAEVFDLFFSGREIKTVRMPASYSGGKHRLRIWPARERNSFSEGNDVLLHMVTLMKPFDPEEILNGHGRVTNRVPASAVTAAVGPDEALAAASVGAVPEEVADMAPGDENRVVRLYSEENAQSPAFSYTGGWAVKDGVYRFVDGRSTPGEAIVFEKEFVLLELKFIGHAWSGKVEVSVDGTYREVIDLYRPEHGELSIPLQRKLAQGKHQVTIRPLAENNGASNGYEVFFGGIGIRQDQRVEITDEELEAHYKVSVIINTLDRDEHLEKLLKALSVQTYPYFEIVVVNGPSRDRTEEVLAAYKGRIKVATCPEANLSWSRNIGIEHAAGDYVAFIDDDALPCDRHWIGNFIYYIIGRQQGMVRVADGQTGMVGAVGGPVKHRDTEHYEFKNGASSDYGFNVFREEELAGIRLDGKRWIERVPGGNAIMLKSALYDINGFDEKFIYYLDETDVCIQLARKGYAILNNPINYIRHYKAQSKVRKSNYDIAWNIIARSDMYFAIKNGFDPLPVRVIKAIRAFRRKHFYIEITGAFKEGRIGKDEYRTYMKRLKSGFNEGLKWGLFERKRRVPLQDRNTSFQNFRIQL